MQAYQLIESVTAQFNDIRVNVDIFHEELCKVALELAGKIQLQGSILYLMCYIKQIIIMSIGEKKFEIF